MKIYEIHDNGGRPYRVRIDDNKAQIYKLKPNDSGSDSESEVETEYERFESYLFKEIFIGENCGIHNDVRYCSPGEFSLGNSILLNIDDIIYIYIGSKIYEFRSLEKINMYCSAIGNNDVPYPYAKTDNYIYFMLEKKYGLRSEFDESIDCYDQFYKERYDKMAIKKDRNLTQQEKNKRIADIKEKTQFDMNVNLLRD